MAKQAKPSGATKGRRAVGKAGQKRVSKKISHLVKEGTPQKQAVATALSMERAGRITPAGGYRRVKKAKKK